MNFDRYMKTIGLIPDCQQAEAIQRTDGATLVLAVPGSGKTTTVIARIGYMVKVKGTDPKSILVITYTRAATADMKSRYESLFGSTDGIEFRTIHGICALILRYFEQVTGRHVFRLAEQSELNAMLKAIVTQESNIPPTEAEMNEIASLITYHINMRSSPEEIMDCSLDNTDFPKVFRRYAEHKKRERIMDHDDQLLYAYSILCTMPDIRKHFTDKYKYINVDEAQDTSMLQHLIIQKLVTDNIYMVGDEDQSIYGFRAAYPDALLKFRDDYHDAKVMLLETNYRSGKKIIDFANSFIKHNQSRYDKTMRPGGNIIGEVPKLTELHDFSSVFSYILSLARNREQETAVLYRSNDSAIPLIDILEKNGIDYNLLGTDTYFLNSGFAARFIDLFEFILNPSDDELFMRAYYLLRAGIKRENAEKAVQIHSTRTDMSLIDICAEYGLSSPKFAGKFRKLPDIALKCRLLSSYDYIKFLDRYFYGDELSDSVFTAENNKYNVFLSIARHYPVKSEFLARLRNIREKMQSHFGRHDCNLTLSTIHSAKGLEFDRVALIDVKNGQLPSIDPDTIKDDAGRATLEEDRRLFYVAATRAKRELIIFTADTENGTPVSRSAFIREAFYPDDDKKDIKKLITAQRFSAPYPARELNDIDKGKKAELSEQEQENIRSNLKRGTVITHTKFGDCLILSVTDKAIRVKRFSDGQPVSLQIDTSVKYGYIKIKYITEEK